MCPPSGGGDIDSNDTRKEGTSMVPTYTPATLSIVRVAIVRVATVRT